MGIEYQLLNFHQAEKYKLEVPDPKDPSRLIWKTFERGFVMSPTHGVQHIDTGLIGSTTNAKAADIMGKIDMQERVAKTGKQFLLEESDGKLSLL